MCALPVGRGRTARGTRTQTHVRSRTIWNVPTTDSVRRESVSARTGGGWVLMILVIDSEHLWNTSCKFLVDNLDS